MILTCLRVNLEEIGKAVYIITWHYVAYYKVVHLHFKKAYGGEEV